MIRMKKLIMVVVCMLAICISSSVCVKAADGFGTSTYYLILNTDNQVEIKTTPDGRALAWIVATPAAIGASKVEIGYDDGKDTLSVTGLEAKSMRLYCAGLAVGTKYCVIDRIEAAGGADIMLTVDDGSYLECSEFIGYSAANSIVPDGNVYNGNKEELTHENVKVSIEDSDKLTYTGMIVQPKVHVTFIKENQGENQEIELTEGVDYTLSYDNNINVGKNAEIKITGTGVYKGSITVTFEIKARSVQSADITVNSCVYDGTAKTPAVTVKIDNEVVASSNYKLQWANNTAASGKAEVIVTGTGNYTGTVKKNFTISTLDITKATVTVSAGPYTYTGSVIKPAVSVTYGKVKIPASDYSVQYTDNKLPGTAKITVIAKGSNMVSGKSVAKTFTIDKAVPAVSFQTVVNATWINNNGKHGFVCNQPDECRGTFTYTSSDASILAVNKSSGLLTVKDKSKFGEVVITAKFTPQTAYADRYKSTTIKHTVKVVSNPVRITSATSSKAGQLVINWGNAAKVYNADSYKIYYYKCVNADDKCGTTQELKTARITKNTVTVSNLTAGKYYIKIVSCYKLNGVVVNGAMSAAYSCVVK